MPAAVSAAVAAARDVRVRVDPGAGVEQLPHPQARAEQGPERRPSVAGDEPPLWRVAITRFDLDASMSASAVDPADALAELLHYASADAAEER